jgi:hypothetical protein
LIRELLNSERQLAITSDQWHVVHAEWSAGDGTPSFTRTIVSEHDDRDTALASARALKLQLVGKMKKRAPESRDQILVKRPSAQTLKSAGRLVRPAG